MAEERKKQMNTEPSLVDPVYQKFTRSIIRALDSNEFYQFFMNAISRADNEIQFSNRKEIKSVDPVWVDAVDDALQGFQNIVSLPRQEIKEEELIVSVAHAKRTGQDVVRHLASHAGLVEDYNAENGSVRPSRVMQKYREESLGLYENRVVFTTLEMAYHFVKIRHDALFEAMSDEYGAKLKVRSDMESATEMVHLDMFLHIRNTESILNTDTKNQDVFDRISRLYRVLGVFMNSPFAKQLSQFERVKGAIHKTNILKRNPDYRAAVKLMEFLRSYDQVGYVIAVVEQNPVVDEAFQRDIFHNVLFNYLVLKRYLEDENDRRLPVKRKPHQQTLKPKFIHQIIEELTQDYDLPDVEIRKVLIEELTKEQLMQEEAEERRRLVEERERKRKEEAERIAAEKKAEAQRLKAEKAAERERIRQEKEAEAQRRRYEKMEREAEERRRSGLFKKEYELFLEHLEEQKKSRLALEEKAREHTELEDYADAVRILEETEQQKREEAAGERRRRQEEKERLRLEKEAEEERLRQEKKAEEERLRLAREAAQAKQEEEERQKALVVLTPYIAELERFARHLEEGKQLRAKQAEEIRRRAEEREKSIQARRLHRQEQQTADAVQKKTDSGT